MAVIDDRIGQRKLFLERLVHSGRCLNQLIAA
jgi:hypothetical protein